MPKSKSRRKVVSKLGSGAPVSSSRSHPHWSWLVLILGVVALGAGGAWLWWQSWRAEEEFLQYASRGRQTLSAVETLSDEGRRHLAAGERVGYGTDPPTSGPHDLTWVPTGVYDAAQSPGRLVHSLEHGNIVIYYDKLDPLALETLGGWSGLYDGQWDGIVVVPRPGLGQAVILTAWNKRLRLQSFDPEAGAAFIDAFRGRGPENPVR